MSGDLISRGKLLENFRNTITEKSDTIDWLNMIARQPVEFNVENVLNHLKRLEKTAKEKAAEYDEAGRLDLMDSYDSEATAYRKAITIVKGGGMNDRK